MDRRSVFASFALVANTLNPEYSRNSGAIINETLKTGTNSLPLGTFGNTPRNFFRGPGFNYTNLELYKDFHLN